MFFANCKTVNEIKQEYRRLCFIHHPDIGGDTATMQRLNDEYHEALRNVDGQTSQGSDNRPHVYRYNEAVEQAVMDKVNELLALRLTDVEIMLVGIWVWVSGDTRPVKDQLKAVGLGWHGKRKMWCWHPKEYRSRYNGKASFGDICNVYGVAKFENEKQAQIG